MCLMTWRALSGGTAGYSSPRDRMTFVSGIEDLNVVDDVAGPV